MAVVDGDRLLTSVVEHKRRVRTYSARLTRLLHRKRVEATFHDGGVVWRASAVRHNWYRSTQTARACRQFVIAVCNCASIRKNCAFFSIEWRTYVEYQLMSYVFLSGEDWCVNAIPWVYSLVTIKRFSSQHVLLAKSELPIRPRREWDSWWRDTIMARCRSWSRRTVTVYKYSVTREWQ